MTITSQNDRDLIAQIAGRAMGMAREHHRHDLDKLSVVMDIASAHADVGLRLQEFLDADEFNFAHDAFGIINHMDRTNYPGKLTDCFLPRFTVKEQAA